MTPGLSEHRLESGDATLFWQHWLPDATPRAKMVLIHGFGEHGGRYGSVVSAACSLAIAVYADDHRGHGRSTGQRGFIRHWSEFRGDLATVLVATEAVMPEIPTFLYGHSLGGLIALDFVLHERPELAGLVVSAPILTSPGVSPFLLVLAKVMSRILPRFSLNAGLDVDALSRDPESVAAYVADPLVHSRATARLSTEMARTQRWVQAHAGELELPLLILHGGADAIAPPDASRLFFERAASRDKRRIEYPGGYHEPHNDSNRTEVMADFWGWLEERL